MRTRGNLLPVGAIALLALLIGAGFWSRSHLLSVRPPSMTGTLTISQAGDTDPRARGFLADVGRPDPGLTDVPTLVTETTVRWHLSRPVDAKHCSVVVLVHPQAAQRLGWTATGVVGNVALGNDFVQKRAFHEPGPPNSLSSEYAAFSATPAGTDGTITFVDAYPAPNAQPAADTPAGTVTAPVMALDLSGLQAEAMVECQNHVPLLGQTREVAGTVTSLPLTKTP